jgi:hypothetical protein
VAGFDQKSQAGICRTSIAMTSIKSPDPELNVEGTSSWRPKKGPKALIWLKLTLFIGILVVISGGSNSRAQAHTGSESASNFDHSKLESGKSTTYSTGKDKAEGLWILQDYQRRLEGSGAHRTLLSVVIISASSSEVESVSESCRLRLLLRLPSGVFADQYELKGIQRRGGLLGARIHGDVNVERPAFLSANSTVDVQVALLKIADDRSNGSLQAEVVLPLHARYPLLSFASHSVVHIPMPDLFVSCQDVEGDAIAPPVTDQWQQVSVTEPGTRPGVLGWMVPAGNPEDYSFVARFTAIAALSGVLVVFAASVAAEQRK